MPGLTTSEKVVFALVDNYFGDLAKDIQNEFKEEIPIDTVNNKTESHKITFDINHEDLDAIPSLRNPDFFHVQDLHKGDSYKRNAIHEIFKELLKKQLVDFQHFLETSCSDSGTKSATISLLENKKDYAKNGLLTDPSLWKNHDTFEEFKEEFEPIDLEDDNYAQKCIQRNTIMLANLKKQNNPYIDSTISTLNGEHITYFYFLLYTLKDLLLYVYLDGSRDSCFRRVIDDFTDIIEEERRPEISKLQVYKDNINCTIRNFMTGMRDFFYTSRIYASEQMSITEVVDQLNKLNLIKTPESLEALSKCTASVQRIKYLIFPLILMFTGNEYIVYDDLRINNASVMIMKETLLIMEEFSKINFKEINFKNPLHDSSVLCILKNSINSIIKDSEQYHKSAELNTKRNSKVSDILKAIASFIPEEGPLDVEFFRSQLNALDYMSKNDIPRSIKNFQNHINEFCEQYSQDSQPTNHIKKEITVEVERGIDIDGDQLEACIARCLLLGYKQNRDLNKVCIKEDPETRQVLISFYTEQEHLKPTQIIQIKDLEKQRILDVPDTFKDLKKEVKDLEEQGLSEDADTLNKIKTLEERFKNFKTKNKLKRDPLQKIMLKTEAQANYIMTEFHKIKEHTTSFISSDITNLEEDTPLDTPGKIKYLEKGIENLKRYIESIKPQITALKEEMDLKEQRLKQTNQKLRVCNEKINNLIEQNRTLQDERRINKIRNLKKKIKDLKKERSELTKELIEYSRKKTIYSHAGFDISHLETRVQALRSQYRWQKAELSNALLKRNTLRQNEMSSAQERLKTLKREIFFTLDEYIGSNERISKNPEIFDIVSRIIDLHEKDSKNFASYEQLSQEALDRFLCCILERDLEEARKILLDETLYIDVDKDGFFYVGMEEEEFCHVEKEEQEDRSQLPSTSIQYIDVDKDGFFCVGMEEEEFCHVEEEQEDRSQLPSTSIQDASSTMMDQAPSTSAQK